MDVRREGKRGLLHPLAGQNSMFFDFLVENSMFYGVFKQIICFCPPPGKFCPPLEKSLRTPMPILALASFVVATFVSDIKD